MELRHLRYFIAVAEKENVSRAASALHVSQPSLSRQIRDLEDHLGFPLFERTAKSISLTTAGKVFLREAKSVMKKAQEAVEKGRNAAKAKESVFHIGYAPSPTAEFLPELLRKFQKSKPTRVVLHDLSSDEMLEGLSRGNLQIALMVEQPTTLRPDIKFERLCSYSVGVIVSPGHRLASRTSVTNSDVIKESLVVFGQREYPDYHVRLRQWLGAARRKLSIVEECDGILSMVAAVESERGIAVCSKGVMILAGSRVSYIPLIPPPPPVFVVICYRRRDLGSEDVQLFLQTARLITKKEQGVTKA
ncbi:MAG: LysR substrate-binding domain-containing protein [Verrucomicrobiales bacterium]